MDTFFDISCLILREKCLPQKTYYYAYLTTTPRIYYTTYIYLRLYHCTCCPILSAKKFKMPYILPSYYACELCHYTYPLQIFTFSNVYLCLKNENKLHVSPIIYWFLHLYLHFWILLSEHLFYNHATSKYFPPPKHLEITWLPSSFCWWNIHWSFDLFMYGSIHPWP